MSLPKHVKLSACVPDPHRRVNHILHVPTDEVFHVTPDLAASVRKMNERTPDKAPQSGKASKDKPETGITLAPQTPAEESASEENASEENADTAGHETDETPDRAELLQMAEVLGIEVSENISDADLKALVEEKAVQA